MSESAILLEFVALLLSSCSLCDGSQPGQLFEQSRDLALLVSLA
jgi:hypothetical protein